LPNHQSLPDPSKLFSMSNLPSLRIGILTVSDRASSGVYEDISGPAIRDYLQGRFTAEVEFIYHVIPDERPLIESTLIKMCDDDGCSLICTTGGTGPAVRDVTPEATEAVSEKMLPGFGEAMRAHSLKTVPTAILSRQTAGFRKQSLIINLPGKPVAIAECLSVVVGAIPYCVELIGGPKFKLS
jgi:molybdopterin adenylyltransferase